MKKTRYVILGLLRDESLTGYEIKKCIEVRMSFFWQESFGQIYPELNALLNDGFITETADERKDNSRRKKKYAITAEGLSEFNRWMGEKNEKDTIRSESLLKLFLATDANARDLVDQLNEMKKQNEEQLLLFEFYSKQLPEYADHHENHKYIQEVLSLGIRQSELYSSWSDSLLQRLKDGHL